MASWLWGSIGRGEGDALSDIDLWCVIADAHMPAIVAEARAFAAHIERPLLFVEAPQNAPEAGAYLMVFYDGATAPLQVDWYWQPHSRAFIPAGTRLMFDRAGLERRDATINFAAVKPDPARINHPEHVVSYFWSMLLIVAKQIYRSPGAAEMPLLPYALDPFEKTRLRLGRPRFFPEGAVPRPRSLAEKADLFRRLADEMQAMMKPLAEQGYSMPMAAGPAAQRYLDLLVAAADGRSP